MCSKVLQESRALHSKQISYQTIKVMQFAYYAKIAFCAKGYAEKNTLRFWVFPAIAAKRLHFAVKKAFD